MNFITTNHGPALKAAAKRLAPFVALAITCLWLAADAAFDLGRQLRLAIEARSEQLAALHLALLGLEPTARPARVAAVVAPAAPVAPSPSPSPSPAPAPAPTPRRIRRVARAANPAHRGLAAA
jgi:hypothetical protein